MSEIFGSDVFSPKEIAQRVNNIGVAKVQLPFCGTFFKGMLCIANMYIIPLAMLEQTFGSTNLAIAAVTWSGFSSNLVPVILGNLVGGSLFVALVYHIIYRRNIK